MPDVADIARVPELLADARIAREAANIAAENGNRGEMCRLRQKSRDLRADAHKIDPEHRCEAWDTARGTQTT